MTPSKISTPPAKVIAREAPINITLTHFDRPHYLKLIQARAKTIRRTVTELKTALGLETALDAGCGVGFFAQVLAECGLSVGGFDGRSENVAEARNRFPEISFEVGNIEESEIVQLGKSDLVLCFGLLYHLENPMMAIRHLRALTGKGLLLESMCVPGKEAGLLLREEPSSVDQSLTEIALYPNEKCLVKMLYRAGYQGVYRVMAQPDHEDFREAPGYARRRTVLFAGLTPLRLDGLERVEEPRDDSDPWVKSEAPITVQRLKRFARKPAREKYIALATRARRIFSGLPIPLRLDFGAWWIAKNSGLDQRLLSEGFEGAELRFVGKLLRPGMNVVDAGAHHGLYTLRMSRLVGRTGRVLAVEPSPRERKRLARHIRVNGCWNVEVESCALGAEEREAELFLVEGIQDWCNSLRPPEIEERSSRIQVAVRRLDDVLAQRKMERVDFIKMDVEGAEWSVLRGATGLLSGEARPAILAEVQDARTRAWGYAAREIIRFLAGRNYRWFALAAGDALQPVPTERAEFDGNLVALPEERAEEFQKMLVEKAEA